MDKLSQYSSKPSSYLLSKFKPDHHDDIELPSFDELKHLAEQDPESFEILRKSLCEKTIAQAPINKRKRLRGLQFKIDMERQRCDSSLASCIRISELMNESLLNLNSVLSDPEGYAESRNSQQASIIRFRPKATN